MRTQEHRTTGPPGDRQPGLRVSDREREHAVDLLAEHAAQGRLTLAELEDRIDAAHGARTRRELAALMDDLPGDTSSDRPERGARGPRPDRSHPLVAFVAVNVVLVAIWALSGAGYFWPAWPLLGWGLCLARPGPRARWRAVSDLVHGQPVSPLHGRPAGAPRRPNSCGTRSS